METATEVVLRFRESLPKVVDPAAISCRAKIPYKLVVFREAILWRTEELGRCACDLFQRGDVGCAIVLTRAVMENAAVVVYLMDLIERQIKDGTSPDLDELAMRLLMGSLTWDEMPKAVRVSTVLKRADKFAPGIYSVYSMLSEYVHPNWSGTAGLFSRHDTNNLRTELGSYPRGRDEAAGIGLNGLLLALAIIENCYNSISDLLPDFVKLCELALGPEEK